MNDQPKDFPPRVGIERQHKDALTGAMRWRSISGPMAHYIIDPVVNDEYLSLEEHDHEMLRQRDRLLANRDADVSQRDAKITELEQKVKDLEAKLAEVEARIWEEAEREVYFDDKKFRTALQMNHYCAARAKEARSRAAQSTKTEGEE